MSEIRKGGKHSNSNIETHTNLIKREEYTGWTPIHAAQVTLEVLKALKRPEKETSFS